MKFNDRQSDTGETIVTWSDHSSGCKSCRSVDIAQSATFVHACVMGSQLLREELAKRAAPEQKRKRDEELKWAQERGVFVTHRNSKDAIRRLTHYVNDTEPPAQK